jgi:hypothetical protein
MVVAMLSRVLGFSDQGERAASRLGQQEEGGCGLLSYLMLPLSWSAGDPLEPWFESLHNKVGLYCCAKADGQPLDDGEWDIKDSSHRVFVRDQWIVVPDDAIILAPNKFGKAIVWLQSRADLASGDLTFSTHITCFIPGSGV